MNREEKIEFVRRLKSDGLTDAVIAETLGVSTSAVFRLRRSAGIAGLPNAGRPPRRVAAEPEGGKRREGHEDDALRTRQIDLMRAAFLRVVARAMAGEET